MDRGVSCSPIFGKESGKMGSWKETATVYECGIMSGNTAPDTGSGMISRSAGKENVIPEKNRMGLVQDRNRAMRGSI